MKEYFLFILFFILINQIKAQVENTTNDTIFIEQDVLNNNNIIKDLNEDKGALLRFFIIFVLISLIKLLCYYNKKMHDKIIYKFSHINEIQNENNITYNLEPSNKLEGIEVEKCIEDDNKNQHESNLIYI